MYYFPQPPFLAALIGLFIAFTFGLVFENLIEQKLQESYRNSEAENSFKLDNPVIVASYFGTCFGSWLFLGGGFLIFSFGVIPAYGVALLLTIVTGALIWQQLGEVLLQIKAGGPESLSLD